MSRFSPSILKNLCLLSLFVGLNSLFGGSASPSGNGESYDVLVYGGTPGGICAALAAAREGQKTLLVEPAQHLGGMISGGLNATDFKKVAAIGGIEKEYYRKVARYYSDKYGPKSEQVAATAARFNSKEDAQKVLVYPGIKTEPHVGEAIFEEMVRAESNLKVLKGMSLDSVTVADRQITRAKFRESKPTAPAIVAEGDTSPAPLEIKAKEFIDASYCGDLMAAAGVTSRIGIEGKQEYGESLGPGSPSEEVQAYSYRITLTSNPENRVPITKPENYNPEHLDFEWAVQAKSPAVIAEALKKARTSPARNVHWNILPNHKFDANLVPFHGANWEYPAGDAAKREEIERAHRDFYLSYLYFVQNDERVPAEVREEYKLWGLCADEFTDNDHFPNQLYVREGRRLVGEYVMTQADIETNLRKPDNVGIGDYSFDSKGTFVSKGKDGKFTWRHSFERHLTSAYEIPYRALVPKKSEITNLLVPVCLSASEIAWSSLRMEPVFMRAGQVAGTAAALAIKEKVPVQQVPVEKLQAALTNAGAVISLDSLDTLPVPWECTQ